MKKLKIILLTAAIVASIIPSAYAEEKVLKIYVSPTGKDTYSGTAEAPYKTIKRAARAVETLNRKKTCWTCRWHVRQVFY